jgi:hypothetical protein
VFGSRVTRAGIGPAARGCSRCCPVADRRLPRPDVRSHVPHPGHRCRRVAGLGRPWPRSARLGLRHSRSARDRVPGWCSPTPGGSSASQESRMEPRSDTDPCTTGTPWKGAGLPSILHLLGPNLDGGRHDEPGQHPGGRRLAAAALLATTPPNNTIRRAHAVPRRSHRFPDGRPSDHAAMVVGRAACDGVISGSSRRPGCVLRRTVRDRPGAHVGSRRTVSGRRAVRWIARTRPGRGRTGR